MLGSEPLLANLLDVSRTTVRTILRRLIQQGILHVEGREKRILRYPDDHEYYPDLETESSSRLVERKFMQMILEGDLRPGSMINTLELARQLEVSTSAIREYLSGFSRYGLIAKRPNSSWVFQGFTRSFALELSEIRELFEMKSIELLAEQADLAATRKVLSELREAHLRLLKTVETDFHQFSGLDEIFHRTINDACDNRFIREFYDVISLIFHYHFQWNQVDERERNEAALLEHLAIIDALEAGDTKLARKAMSNHLKSSRESLVRSISDRTLK
jgi:DNA-binding GntR family transcriptional regulator